MNTNNSLTYSNLVDLALILNHEEITLKNSNKILGKYPEIVAINKKDLKKVKVLQAKINNMLGAI